MSIHIGARYGSEFHLMRYLARYRKLLNSRIEEKTGGRVIEWLDFVPGKLEEYDTSVSGNPVLPDHELVGLEFLKDLPEYRKIADRWTKFWPQSGNQQNWDAVGKVDIDGVRHWLLVEAKANLLEIESDCGAKSEFSIKKIDHALKDMCGAFGLKPKDNLKREYYQYANRLAVLHFLTKNNRSAKLLSMYFCGDKNPGKEESCPQSEQDWREGALNEQDNWIGLNPERKKAIGIIELFLDVVPSLCDG